MDWCTRWELIEVTYGHVMIRTHETCSGSNKILRNSSEWSELDYLIGLISNHSEIYDHEKPTNDDGKIKQVALYLCVYAAVPGAQHHPAGEL